MNPKRLPVRSPKINKKSTGVIANAHNEWMRSTRIPRIRSNRRTLRVTTAASTLNCAGAWATYLARTELRSTKSKATCALSTSSYSRS